MTAGFPLVSFISVAPCPICVPFPAPARQTVHAVLPHTAYRRRSPPAFGATRQDRKGLGATTVLSRRISPS